MKKNEIYKRLVASLQLVASPCEIQIKLFPDFVVVADEIALTYDASYALLYQLSDQIAPAIMEKLKKLNDLFEEMSKDSSLWDIVHLKKDHNWMECRYMANIILKDLGEVYAEPSLDFITFVK